MQLPGRFQAAVGLLALEHEFELFGVFVAVSVFCFHSSVRVFHPCQACRASRAVQNPGAAEHLASLAPKRTSVSTVTRETAYSYVSVSAHVGVCEHAV